MQPKKRAKTVASVKSVAPAKTPAPAPGPLRSAAKQHAGPRKAPLDIPALLLEGDPTSPTTESGPGHRYALGPGHGQEPEIAGGLPDSYGTGRLFLTARDPHWLYAAWDLTPAQLRRYNRLSTKGRLTLRVYRGALEGKPFAEVLVHPESRYWFVHVADGGSSYVAQLGYYAKGRRWMVVSTSGSAATPMDSLADESAVQFESVPPGTPLPELLKLVASELGPKTPLMEGLHQLRASGVVLPSLAREPETASARPDDLTTEAQGQGQGADAPQAPSNLIPEVGGRGEPGGTPAKTPKPMAPSQEGAAVPPQETDFTTQARNSREEPSTPGPQRDITVQEEGRGEDAGAPAKAQAPIAHSQPDRGNGAREVEPRTAKAPGPIAHRQSDAGESARGPRTTNDEPRTPSGERAAWTFAQAEALAQLINFDDLKQWRGSSAEIAELVRQKLRQRLFPEAGGAEVPPSEMAGAAWPELPPNVSSPAVPFGRPKGESAGKGFWLNVNAELVVYGATEPDAQVALGGRPILLRPDGTFSVRFALPNGEYELPIEAEAADGAATRSVRLKFRRASDYRGAVQAPPQDPSLKPPRAEILGKSERHAL